jgi:glycosyltransferase involved in cell wall biosynthesis
MNILHIVSHLGDGGGKAVGGLARLGNRSGEHTHRILLLDKPMKFNHIERCKEAGVEIFEREQLESAISSADVVVVNWWSGRVMEEFLRDFPELPCRTLLWSHVNGYFLPKFPDNFAERFDGLLATSQFTLDNTDWQNSELVYGIGDFTPTDVIVKSNYDISDDVFRIGYVGMPGYKRFPPDCTEYFAEVIKLIPSAKFVMAGETSDEFRNDICGRGLEHHFEFLGWVADIGKWLATFDVLGYLMKPDTSATTENSVIEAMAAGVPCVVSKRPIGKYLLIDGESGFLTDNPREYAEAILRLFCDKHLRECVGIAGREYVSQKYDSKENLERFNKMIEGL